MKYKKKLQELTLKDNFMFGAVMTDEDNCKEFLEMALGFPIAQVTVSKEKSMVYHPEYKGIRLDVIAKDEKRTHYNVEMQVAKKKALGKRTRYYHSQIDMDLLQVGMGYDQLPNAYVVFICDYDPFGAQLYRYTWKMSCCELRTVSLEDGSYTIFLNTCGTNKDEVPEELVKFLEFIGADLAESTKDYKDDFVHRLQTSVANIKASREMEERYMLLREYFLEEMGEELEEAKAEGREKGRAEGREEGRAEGRAEGQIDLIREVLEDFGEDISEEMKQKIQQETDLAALKMYFRSILHVRTLKNS